MEKNSWTAWTPEEVSHIKQFYPFISGAELANLFDGRHTERSLRDKAWRLGIKKCHDRLRQMGCENVGRRWARVRAQQQPPPPPPAAF